MVDPTRSRSEAPGGEWLAESWRLTTFTTSPLDASQLTWWEALVGEPPETEQVNRRQGVFQSHGRFGRGRLVLALQADRVDWLYTVAPPNPGDSSDEVPALGPAAETIVPFRELLVRWFADAPPITRLAIGGVLLRPAGDRPEAYQIIARHVPGLRLDTEGCSDFIYQINRPRSSAIYPDLVINRLSKWSAAVASLLGFIPTDPTNMVQRELYTVARLELDINTVPGYALDLGVAGLGSLTGELIGLGLEIAERGDVP